MLHYRRRRSLAFSDNSTGNLVIFCLQRILNGCTAGYRKVLKFIFVKVTLAQELNMPLRWHSCKVSRCLWICAHTAVYSGFLLLCLLCQLAVLSVLLGCGCWAWLLLTSAPSLLVCLKNEIKISRHFGDTVFFCHLSLKLLPSFVSMPWKGSQKTLPLHSDIYSGAYLNSSNSDEL